jgi:hypothetical protein
MSALHAVTLPLALGGEAVTVSGPNATFLAIISIVSIVVGYVVIYALWRWVFSAKARDKRGEPPEY